MSGFDEVREKRPKPCEIEVSRRYPAWWFKYEVKAITWTSWGPASDPEAQEIDDRMEFESFIGYATTPERGLRKGERWARRNGHVVVKRVKFDAA